MDLVLQVAQPGADHPQVAALLLHGRGSHEEDLAPLAPVFGSTAHVLAVRAPIPFGPGFAWYGMRPDGGANVEQWRESVVQLDALVEEVRTRLRCPVLLLGFSQGGMMASAVALHRRGRDVPAVVSLSAPPLPMIPEPDSLRGVSVFWGHGTDDPVVTPERGQDALARLLQGGAEVDVHRYPIGHTISMPELRDVERWLTGHFANI